MSLPEALDRLRARADGHDTPFTVLDADADLMELTRLRALVGDTPDPNRLELRAGDGSRLVCTSDPSGRVHLSVAQCPDRSASVVLGTGPATRLARWLGGRAGVVAQPPADLPATLATVDDFRKVFEAAGLSSQDDFGEDTWSGPGVIAEWWVHPGCAALYRSGTGDQFATYFPGASGAELFAVVQVARSAS